MTAVPNPENIVFGEGVFYGNYAETDEFPLGATQGGGTFTYSPEFKAIEYDGSRGDTKGMKRIITSQTQMKVKALELFDTDKIAKLIPTASLGTETLDAKTYDALTVSETVEDADYLKNIAFVGKKADGKEIIIIMYNVLPDGALEATLEANSEVVPELTLTAHRDRATPNVVPFKILLGQ